MKYCYGNFQRFSYCYYPDTGKFEFYFHSAGDDREKVFARCRINSVFTAGPEHETVWLLSARKESFFLPGETAGKKGTAVFEITLGYDSISLFLPAGAVVEGTLFWSEKTEDVLPGNDKSTSAALYGASGPVIRKGDNMLFDRKSDRALFFREAELSFDWEKNTYCFSSVSNGKDPLSFQVKEDFVANVSHMRYTPIEKKLWFDTPPVGWMTWYATRFEASAAEVAENTQKMHELLGKYSDKLVTWVDWEWYHKNIKGDGEGNGNIFEPCKDTYPDGMAAVAEKIREMGGIPALWIGPTCEGNKNKWFEEHPDCIIGPYPRWCGQWWIDPSRREITEEYIPLVMKTVLDWGYIAVKWDCTTMSSYVWEEYRHLLSDPGSSIEQYQHRIFEAGRKALGEDIYFLLCNPVADHDLAVASDLCDSARIGGDIFKWDEFIEHAIDHLHHFYPIHNTILYADCDNLVIREEFNSINQARSRVSFYGLSGIPVTFGDRFSEYDEVRLDMIRRIVPAVDMNPLEFISKTPGGNVRLFVADFSRSFGSWQVVSVCNIDNEKVLDQTVDLAEICHLETGSGRRYAVYDFWNGSFMGIVENELTCRVEPLDTVVLRVTPIEDELLPTLISSSRHITQGGHELLEMKRDVSGGILCGKVRCVEGEVCRLSFFVPEGMSVEAEGGPWEQNGSCGILYTGGKEGGVIDWSLKIC